MGEYFAKSCGKGYETEVTEMGENYLLFLTVMVCSLVLYVKAVPC